MCGLSMREALWLPLLEAPHTAVKHTLNPKP